MKSGNHPTPQNLVSCPLLTSANREFVLIGNREVMWEIEQA